MAKANRATSIATKQEADRFRKAADSYVARAAASKKSARKTLVALGIHTRSGRLTKRYK